MKKAKKTKKRVVAKEGSKQDMRIDKAGMAKYGIKTMKEWEKSPEDKRMDDEQMMKRIKRATSSKSRPKGMNSNPTYKVTY